MKVLVFAHRLEVGGTQVNAIDLAAGLRDRHGFEIVFFAGQGPMTQLVQERGLRYVEAPDARLHPSVSRMRALRRLVRDEKPDLIHAWDWWQCIDAYYSVHLPWRVPMVVSDMMMELTRILPKQVWTTFGTPELADRARKAGRLKVAAIAPPIDLRRDNSDVVDGRAFRERYAGKGEVLVVTVSRLAVALKAESLMRTIEAVDALGRDVPLKFVIVGDGAVRPQLERLAARTNTTLGREAVVCVGALRDPRQAYAAADFVVGMGGSALRAMSFGKPVVVVGEHGFSAPFDSDTAETFHYRGFYGVGPADPGNERLKSHIRKLAASPRTRAEVGAFSRRFVSERFSLDATCEQLAEVFRHAVADRARLAAVAGDVLRTTGVYLRERRFLTASRARHPTDSVGTKAI